MKQTLRPYQHEMLKAISAAVGKGQTRVLCQAATGAGKTTCFAALPTYPDLQPWWSQFAANDRAMLVIAHREELLDQAAARISQANPGLMVCIEQGDRYANRYADVVIASIQTLQASKFKRLKKLLTWRTWRLVVVDEAHHAAASTYRTALAHLGFLPAVEITDTENTEAANFDDVKLMEEALRGWDQVAPRDRLLVGVTATPNRSDAVGLGCVFQAIGFTYPIKRAISDGWLVPIVPYAIETKESLENIHTVRGDYNQRELANAVNVERRNLIALKAWEDYARGLATIAFTVDVAHAHDTAALFVKAGHKAAALSGETPKDDRRLMLEQFTNGQIDIITNCMVLTEGTDLPRTSCILHLKPTKSATLYEQMTGRGLRLFEGKDHCIVIDLVDVAKKLSLQTAPVLYGLPPQLAVKGKTLETAEAEYEDLLQKHPGLAEEIERLGLITLDQLGMRASRFDIWAVPSLGDFGRGRALDWVKFGECYRVQYPWLDGHETIQVEPNLVGAYEVACTFRVGKEAPRQRTIATGLQTAVEAAKVAEAYVQGERQSIMRLKAPDAAWKQGPASDKQLGLLRQKMSILKRMGHTVPEIPKRLTKGEASTRIDRANLLIGGGR